MKFYYDKLKEIRKQKKISLIDLAAQLEMSRATLWTWETGRIQPSEKMVRRVAKALSVSVSQLSDLQHEAPVSNTANISRMNSLLYSYGNTNLKERRERQSYFIDGIKRQFDELNQVSAVIGTFVNSIQLICYIKDLSLKYVLVNEAFLKNLSLEKDYNVLGKEDKDFFSEREAKQNTEEDGKVIYSGVSVNREDFIPGNKKRRWGIISKVPIFDFSGRITGVLAYFTDITERKKNELLIEQFLKGLDMMDAVIWMAKGAKDTPNGLRAEKYLYSIKNSYLKKVLGINEELTDVEAEKYYELLVLDNKTRGRINLADLKKTGEAEIRYKMRTLDNRRAVNVHSKIYYNKDADLYVGIMKEDKETERIEKAIEMLRQNGVNEEIVSKASTILKSTI